MSRTGDFYLGRERDRRCRSRIGRGKSPSTCAVLVLTGGGQPPSVCVELRRVSDMTETRGARARSRDEGTRERGAGGGAGEDVAPAFPRFRGGDHRHTYVF